ncbi:hypothetical protein SAMN05444148_2440 [Winogradskyella jejuensis]|uniref:Uncharacterized protein n=1 Tax=Winogradskyella jejuensis TaxID=1089305 RepID=A0A1M5UD46_9FLAO|nr:hypothetical protein SAMN05444148_2440 [Winogradskyella jejuensis]
MKIDSFFSKKSLVFVQFLAKAFHLKNMHLVLYLYTLSDKSNTLLVIFLLKKLKFYLVFLINSIDLSHPVY